MAEKEKTVLNEKLFQAIKEKTPKEVIEALIKAGTNVNANGAKPLTAAEAKDFFNLLVESGVNVNANSVNPISEKDLLNLLVESGTKVNTTDSDRTDAMMAKTTEQTKHLIKAGADVNKRDETSRPDETEEKMKFLAVAGLQRCRDQIKKSHEPSGEEVGKKHTEEKISGKNKLTINPKARGRG